ncbi:MAG: AAA family ATPase, partial [Acidilobaceae archaeon]
MIKKVELKNVMSHEHTVVEFGRGVNAIVGPNGSGKSSIIDSIIFALVGGCVRGEETVRAELSNMVRVGSTKASIAVEFEISGKCYRVERTITTSLEEAQSQFILKECTGQLIAHGKDSFCNKMSELLGLKNLKVLSYTLVARQGHLSDFIDSEPSKRAEMILDLLGMAWLDKAKETLGRALRGLEIEVALLEKEEERLRKLEAERAQLRKRVEELENKEKSALNKVEELEKKTETLKKEVEEYRSLWTSLDKLRAYERYKREIETLESEVEELKRKLKKLAPFREAKELVERGLSYYVTVNNRVRTIEDLLKKAEDRLKSLLGNSTLSDVEKEVEELRKLEEDLVHKYKELSAEEKLLSATLQAGLSGDKCPLCGSPLNEERKKHMIETHITRLKELREELPKVKMSLEEITARRRRLENVLREVADISREAERLKQDLDNAQKELKSFLERYNELASKLGFPKAESFVDCKLKEIAKLVEEAEEIEKLLARKLGSLESLRLAISQFSAEELSKVYDILKSKGLSPEELEKKYLELNNSYESMSRELGRAKEELSLIRGELNALRSQLSAKETELNKLRDTVKSLEVKKKVVKIASRLHEDYLGKSGQLSKVVLESFRKNFVTTVNDVLTKLNRDFLIDLGKDLEIYVKRGGQSLSISSLSGGEKTMLAIVSRMALASMISGKRVSALILDEPTEYLDVEVRKTVF